MSKPNPERRGRRRVSARVPITVKGKDGIMQNGVTRDVSTNGMFLYVDGQVAPGNELEFVLMLPPEIGMGEKRWVCCQASVVRVESTDTGQTGVAATIDRLEVIPEIEG